MKNQATEIEIPTLIKDGKSYETDDEKARVFAERMAETFRESSDSANRFDKENYEKVTDFVKNKHFWITIQGSCNGDALTLPA